MNLNLKKKSLISISLQNKLSLRKVSALDIGCEIWVTIGKRRILLNQPFILLLSFHSLPIFIWIFSQFLHKQDLLRKVLFKPVQIRHLWLVSTLCSSYHGKLQSDWNIPVNFSLRESSTCLSSCTLSVSRVKPGPKRHSASLVNCTACDNYVNISPGAWGQELRWMSLKCDFALLWSHSFPSQEQKWWYTILHQLSQGACDLETATPFHV